MNPNECFETEFAHYDEYLQDDPFQLVSEDESLGYRDEVATNLITLLHEYLEFATMRDFIVLMANNL